MTLNFPTSIYTNDDAETALGPNTVLTPTDGDTITIGSYGYTFDDDRVDSNGRWVLNSGSTYSLTGGATYTWDLYKWKASNIPDSSNVVQTSDNPSDGEVLTYNGTLGVNVWASATGGVTVQDEGTTLSTIGTTLNFTGNGVTATGTGSTKTINITDTNTTYSNATTTTAGLMSASDKNKLNSAITTSGGTINGSLTVNGTFIQDVNTAASSNNTITMDCDDGNYFTHTINANSTFATPTNPPNSSAYVMTLKLDHVSGSVTWWNSLYWPNNTAPVLTPGKKHLFVFVTDDSGTTWRGAALVDYTN